LATFVAEPKNGSQEIGTQSNPDLMEGMMFRVEGEHGPTLGKFWSFYFHPLILRNCGIVERYGSYLLFALLFLR
jgi:hypothetical protein